MKESLKSWIKKIFLRDMTISRNGFLYFLAAFTFVFIAVDYLILSFITFNPIQILSPTGITSGASILATIVFSGLIVDKFKNRMRLLVISAFVMLIGLFAVAFHGTSLDIIGYVLVIFGAGVFFIDLMTVIIHETSLLNRGRMLGYQFFFSFIIGHSVLFLCGANILVIAFIEAGLFVLLIYISTKYTYLETEERLQSDLKFREAITGDQSTLGYIIAFCVFGFILGNAFPVEMKELAIEPVAFIVLSLSFLVISGVFLDNMGRKWAFTGGILIVAILIIFAGIFKEIYEAVFFGMSIPIAFILLFTFAGDFSTERNTLKYRGRISAIFVLFIIGGFLAGILLRYVSLNIIYTSNPVIWYWLPGVINGVNSLLLIILLVWIMPLPEIFSSKEADWADALRNLYVFNRDSICLYTKSYLHEEDMLDLPSEDLITGGLTGILTLISEITNEKKNLRIIDKERVKIYFAYGKNIIVALITTKYLPILFKKLEQFAKAFERRFEHELDSFAGKINVFLNNTEDLVQRYFK